MIPLLDIENRPYETTGLRLEQVDFPNPWISPMRTRLPRTTPPPSTRFLHLGLGPMDVMEVHVCQFHELGLFAIKDTLLNLSIPASSTKEDQAPQLGQRPRYLGEL